MTDNQTSNFSEDLNANLQTTINQTSIDMGLTDMAVTVGVVTPYLKWSGASGIADLATQEATATDDLFNIGSISKAFTSAVILKLQEQGKLSLNDTLGQWLPEIAASIPNSKNLTLRQILNGTAGIFDYINNEAFLSDLATDYLSGGDTNRQIEDLLAYFIDKPVSDQWVYPNTGNLLGVIIAEAATGQDFTDILTEEILQPLGLENTFFTTEEVDPEKRARGYDDIFLSNGSLGEDGILEDTTSVSTTIAIGAGSIVASAEDVAIFFDALASGELLKPDSTEEIFNYVETGMPGLEQFGLGAFPDEYTWGNSRTMNGGIFGYSSYVDYLLRDDTTISVLLNRSNAKSAITAMAYKSALANTLNLSNALSLEGTAEDDYLKETSGGDVVWGYAGDDRIFGYDGNDILDGGADNDFLQGNQGNDLLFGQAGKDILDGGVGDDFINGGNNSDRIFGGKGNDSLVGGKGKDSLTGGEGKDLLDGGFGNDLIRDFQGSNVLYGGSGRDSLYSGSGDDLLYGEVGNDYLKASKGDDLLVGGAGNDTLSGGAGINTLAGGLGKDVFILSVDGTAIVNDFAGDQDLLELTDKIRFGDLTIIQGEGENANDTVITLQEETVAILRNTNANTISSDDFIGDVN